MVKKVIVGSPSPMASSTSMMTSQATHSGDDLSLHSMEEELVRMYTELRGLTSIEALQKENNNIATLADTKEAVTSSVKGPSMPKLSGEVISEISRLLICIEALPVPNTAASTAADLGINRFLSMMMQKLSAPIPQTATEVRDMVETEIERMRRKIELDLVQKPQRLGKHLPLLHLRRLNEILVAISKPEIAKFTLQEPEAYATPFTTFLTENPTVFHAVDYFAKKLTDAGYTKVWNSGPTGLHNANLHSCLNAHHGPPRSKRAASTILRGMEAV